MSYKKFNFGTDNSWSSKASDYPDEIIKNNPVGESTNIGSIGSIADLFHDRWLNYYLCKQVLNLLE